MSAQEPDIKMSAGPPKGLSLSGPRDGLDDLLSRTRAMRQRERSQREQWFGRLPLEGKETILFELEVLLKATACFSNPRNHPGPQRQAPIVSLDFRPATLLFRDGMQHASGLARLLQLGHDNAFVFHRYLETVVPHDSARSRLVRGRLAQASPEESLVVLRHQLTSLIEVLEGLLRAPRVPYRTFYAILTLAQREVSRVTYFNPLTALEFRPEFDRLRSSDVLDLIRRMPVSEAHRLVALTFLSLFRMLKYVQLLERLAEAPSPAAGTGGCAALILSVLRSDARALSEYLRQRSGELLGRGFERTLLRTSAREIGQRHDTLRTLGHRLLEVRGALEGIANHVKLENQRLFQQCFPILDVFANEREAIAAIEAAIRELRPSISGTVLHLGRALGTCLEDKGIFDEVAVRRENSERLRRDVWVFARILQRFVERAKTTPKDRPSPIFSSYRAVQEYMSYFERMGYPSLRVADSPRIEDFLSVFDSLEGVEGFSRDALLRAVRASESLSDYLLHLVDEIGQREELKGLSFDLTAAKDMLYLHVGD